MPPTRTGDLSAGMVILGLLVARPDTAAGVGTRLAESFPRARWPRNSVHNSLPSLVRQGFVRVVSRGSEPALDRYEATAEGAVRFRAWVRRSVDLPPALRDGIHARLQFVELDELQSLVETVRGSERACSMEYAAAQSRMQAEKRRARRLPGQASDWRSRLVLIQINDEVFVWGSMVRRLQHLGDELEELFREASAGSTAGD